MKKEWTEQDLQGFVQSAQSVFETVALTEAPPQDGWQDEGMQVDYELRGGRVDCVLRRCLQADGRQWTLTMTSPLAGNVLPEERMTARERELCHEDMNHDFLSGVFNRRYLELVYAEKLAQWAQSGRSAAVALVSLDEGAELCKKYGQPVMDQLIGFVANQWKKHFDIPAERVVCRLTGSTFVVGCADATNEQLAQKMRQLYAQMPHECVATGGVICRVPFTLSITTAGLDEPGCKDWQSLYALCDARMRNEEN